MTQPAPESQKPSAGEPLICRRCGVVDLPLLSPGTGPHAIRASCQHCGRFIRWISTLSPSERMARKVKARLKAQQQHPPTQAQLSFLQALGDQGPAPENMAEASARIEKLQGASRPRDTNALGG